MPKILIIDDDEKLRSLIDKAFAMRGFDVVQTSNGTEGLKLAKIHTPDLIVCDVNMDGLDGYEVLAELKKNPITAATPFIFMTGLADLKGMRQGMTLGADDYLAKPFKVEDLLTAVANRLQKQQMMREQADQKLASLRTNISMMLPHELLTPLTGILGASELLASDAANLSPSQIVEFAQVIRQSGFRLRRLIENFLIYAQIELLAADPAKMASLERSPTLDARTILTSQAGERAQAANRAKDLEVKLCPASVAVSEAHFQKIAFELIDNAFKFSKLGTPVLVASSTGGGTFELVIQDRGRGMKTESLKNIGAYIQFERKFYEQQGSGLGLAIARRLVAIHRGEFSIESELNQGTRIKVALPVA